jgi:DNA polymerase-3 subunit epsilon
MRILFFDTETSGLPKNWNAPVEQLDNWPRLIQLAWQVYDLQGKLIEEEEYVIKPNGFEIPIEASNVHKITTQKAHEIGVDLSLILDIFSNAIKDSDLLVAHNYSFDYSIIGAELLRNGLENNLKNKEYICTMKSSTDFCNISGPYGNKWPKLEELYYKLFQETFNAHDALDDIRATSRCFWKLVSLKIIIHEYLSVKKDNISNNQINSNSQKKISAQDDLKEIKIPIQIEASLIVDKIFLQQKNMLQFLQSFYPFFNITKEGEVEHLIYYFYYVIKFLINTGTTVLMPKTLVDIEENIWKDDPKIVLNDSIIKDLLIFLKSYLSSKCFEFEISINDKSLNDLINGRFNIYKFSDEQSIQEAEEGYGGGRINNELFKLVFFNPLKNKIIIDSNEMVRICNLENEIIEVSILHFVKNSQGLDSYTNLIYSVGIDEDDYNYFNHPTIKIEDYLNQEKL